MFGMNGMFNTLIFYKNLKIKILLMKIYKFITLCILFTSVSYTQTLEDARKKTDNELFEVAGKEFSTLISKEPKRADYYFYSGYNYFEHGDLDSANIMWKIGVDINPKGALNYIGLAKYLWFKGDTTSANIYIKKAFTLTKNKNPEIMRQTAIIYIRTPKYKKLDEAITLLNRAVKIDPKNPENFLLLGDALQEKTPENGSPAIKNYNLALGLNPKSPKAIVRTAKLYQRSGADSLANSKYIEAQLLDPTYAPAYRENAELNMKFNQFKRAIENWKKYLVLNNSNEARYRYATSLFSYKKYCEAISELIQVKSNGMENFYIERMLTYSYYECVENDSQESYQKGLKSSDLFFKIVPIDKIISTDYKYKGYLLSKTGNDSLAIIELENAAKADPKKGGELYGEIAKMYMKNKQYLKAIDSYEKKRDGSFDNLTVSEINDLARSYFYGSKNYVLADSCYVNLTERSPEYTAGYLGLGRSICRQDVKNEKWLAKNSFTKYLELLTLEEKTLPVNKAGVMEAAKYLGGYYILSPEKDKVKAKIYWEIARSVDPMDVQVKAFFKL
jgi:tetratricopeptide (TPR) repeat protein